MKRFLGSVDSGIFLSYMLTFLGKKLAVVVDSGLKLECGKWLKK
jgi:hypothetical protein